MAQVAKIAELEAEMARTQKNKATAKHLGSLKAKIAKLRRETSRFIVRTRAEYTTALRQNLHNLMDGSVSPRHFVQEFFQLTEAGNMRNDIRKKLVISLLMSETVRPSVKFLMLENFHEMPAPVQTAIIQALLRADSSRHVDLMKEELRWIVAQGTEYSKAH